MSDTALDREIQAALDVEPSPAFVARVRQRIAREPSPAPWWHRPELAVVVAAFLAAAGLWTLSQQPVREIPSSSGSMAIGGPPAVSMEAQVEPPAPIVESPALRPASRRAPVPSPAPEGDLPPVILAENERAALRMLGAATRIEPPEPAEIEVSAERSASARPELASVSFAAPDMGRPVFEAVSLRREGDRP